MVWTLSMAWHVAFSSSLFTFFRWPFLVDSATLAAYASKYTYFDLCSGLSFVPGLNSASSNRSALSEKIFYDLVIINGLVHVPQLVLVHILLLALLGGLSHARSIRQQVHIL